MTEQQIHTFEEFWPYYVGQHRDPVCRRQLDDLQDALAPALEPDESTGVERSPLNATVPVVAIVGWKAIGATTSV